MTGEHVQDAFVVLAVLVGAWGTLGSEDRASAYYVVVAVIVIILLIGAMTVGALLP